MAATQETFPATGAEVAISITRAVVDQRIGMALAFESGCLDAARLERAVRLSYDAEPLLGTAFRTDARKAYWQRMPHIETPSILSTRTEVDADAWMRSFQAEEVPDDGPQASVALLRTRSQDVLGIKVSHVLADGQAAKQYAYLLADIYSRLGSDPSYRPPVNEQPRPTGRDVWSGLTAQQRRDARQAKSWARPTWPAPEAPDVAPDLTYRWSTIPPERFLALKSFGSERGCTVNDVMLTAVLRACIDCLDPPTGVPLSLMYTADLRRYLAEPRDLPIVNLSISGSLDIEHVADECFEDALRRVHARMEEWARMCHGAAPFANAERLSVFGYRPVERLLGVALRSGGSSGKTYPWFTNIGVLDQVRLMFDGHAPLSGLMFGPASHGLTMVPVVSTYDDALTVSMGFGDTPHNAQYVEKFLASVVGEIETACV